jgi:acyl-CoA synthetase (AMP-forming)/AMP-acid ligase II
VPLDRVVVQLPNVAEFVILYFALQKIECIPITALVTHRYAEISQFVQLSGAKACVIPERHGDCDYVTIFNRIRKESPTLKCGILSGEPRKGFLSSPDMIATPPKLPASALSALHIDSTDPAVFQLSGGTTGIPKLIPRTHNDYASAMQKRHPKQIIRAWGAVDPFKGEAAIHEAKRAIRDLHMLGFHFHPIMGHFAVNDGRFYPLFEVINELKVPVMIDVGTTGMGAGMPSGMGARIRHAHPSAIDATNRQAHRYSPIGFCSTACCLPETAKSSSTRH